MRTQLYVTPRHQAANEAASSQQQRASYLEAQAAAARSAEAEAQRALMETRRGVDRQEAAAASRIASLEVGRGA